jgi:rubredoxin
MIDKSKFILKDKIAKIQCKSCGGVLRPIPELFFKNGIEAYEKFKQGFKVETGLDWKDSDSWVCCLCGLIYDKDFVNTGNVVTWLPALKEYYGS